MVGAGSSNPWPERRVISYAHQAGAWEAPSSTLFALRRALGLGVGGIELDVHSTADGALVVCHDATVDRTTEGTGAISEMTLDELSDLDNAYWFAAGADESRDHPDAAYTYRGRAPADHDFAVATLEEVLDVLDAHPEVAINLDIKGSAPAVAPYEEALARALHARENLDRFIVASFLDYATDEFSRHAPDIATSAGTAAVAQFWRAVHQDAEPPPMRHAALQVPVQHLGQRIVDERFVKVAHAQGMAVHVWTINDEEEMESLVDLGVDGIISDLPTRLLRVLDRRGVRYLPKSPSA